MESVTLNGRYRLLEMVGSGGMAVVYRGLDTLLQRQVAVKVLREEYASDPAFLARFQREARAAAKLDHPNVVTVYDVGQDGEWHYIVMEYVAGQDLKTLIRQRGRLGVDEAVEIAIQICAGVGHAHKVGIIHCDVKPQNVLVTPDGRAKVTDFGIARALSESGVTESETVWGSPLYLAPEQAAGEPPTPAADVYSIGVVLYEMLSGEPPFRADNPTALALKHMREEPPPLSAHNPQVPARLEWIVSKVLSKEPAARYRTAEQLRHVLVEYRRQSEQRTGYQPAIPSVPPAAAPPSAPSTPAATGGGDRLAWVLGAIAFLAVVGLIPLWLMVYRAYTSVTPPVLPQVTPTPLATFTPAVELVAVPDVLLVPQEEARRVVEQKGLQFVVREERDDPTAAGGVVLEQEPAPGELLPLGGTVSVVINGPGRELTMPNVTGYPVEMVRGGLESDGLNVTVEEVWSRAVRGMVIEQEPEEGATLHAGDVVTLTVSGGVAVPIPLEVNLAETFILESADLRQEQFPPGGVIGVTLRWQVLRATDVNYIVFVHLIGPDGRLVSQQDKGPISPTSTWSPGLVVADPHQVPIPGDIPAGKYQLRTGMYPDGQPGARLPVTDPGQTEVESDSILIVELEIPD